MLAVLEAPLAVGQSFYVAEGVPADRVAALRTAFEAMLADPAFLADAQNANLEINPRSWQDVQAVLADVYAKTTPETAKALDAIFARK
jgi:tripartite-type tricarboxylate transporter receptor subunit TctC